MAEQVLLQVAGKVTGRGHYPSVSLSDTGVGGISIVYAGSTSIEESTEICLYCATESYRKRQQHDDTSGDLSSAWKQQLDNNAPWKQQHGHSTTSATDLSQWKQHGATAGEHLQHGPTAACAEHSWKEQYGPTPAHDLFHGQWKQHNDSHTAAEKLGVIQRWPRDLRGLRVNPRPLSLKRARADQAFFESTDTMLDDYCTLVTMIVETIKVPVEEVVELCKLILSSGVSSKLVAGDMLRLFSRLKKEGHLTFFNQDLLSAIVTKFGDEKCVQSWRQFEGRFQSYCRDRVVQDKVAQDLVYAQREEQTAKRFVARSKPTLAVGKEDLEAETEVVFKIDKHFEDITQESIHSFRGHAARVLGIPDESMLHLKSVKEGCIMLTYSLLAAGAEYIPCFMQSCGEYDQFLQEMNIMFITVENPAQDSSEIVYPVDWYPRGCKKSHGYTPAAQEVNLIFA